MEVYEYYEEDEEEPPRYALFKIKYLGFGRYSIRSMLRNDMGWCSTNNFSELLMFEIGTDDSNIPNYARWRISYGENGYYIYTSDTRTITSSEDSGDDVTTANYQLNNLLQHWSLTKVTTEYNGVTIYRQPKTVVVGRSNKYEASVYSSSININGQNDISWSVSGITGAAQIDSSTGVVTGQSPGKVKVTATYTYSSNKEWSADYTVTILPVSDGTYYFKNAEFTGHNMQIDDNAGLSDEGAILELWDRDGSMDQRWKLSHINDGYYKIISSINDKAVTAPSAIDGNITLTSYNGASNQQWKIEIMGDGTYKIAPKSNASYYISAGDGIITADGRNVRMRSAQNDNKDEWYLEQLYSAVFYGIEVEDDHDHDSALTRIRTEAGNDDRTKEYWNGIELTIGSVSVSECKEDLKTANIFTIRSHGFHHQFNGNNMATWITLTDVEVDANDVNLSSHWHEELLPNSGYIDCADDFSNIDLALFICCETAGGGEGGNNLPTRIVEYGAKAAIGFANNINCEAANMWTTAFYDSLFNGNTLEAAAQNAWDVAKDQYKNKYPGSDVPLGFDGASYDEDIIICGDKSFTLP
jgi:hypothetical protein